MILKILLIVLICIYLYRLYQDYKSEQDPMIKFIKETLLLIDPRASQLTFHKNNKSYSINKRKIYLCLEDEYGNYYSKNTLIYVALHELAHCLNHHDIGHTVMFHSIFQDLLNKATIMGLYKSNLKIPENYCSY